MQARDPKNDRPAAPSGRPAFGVGPIARVARPAPPPGPHQPYPDRGDPIQGGGRPAEGSGSAAPALRPALPIRTAFPGRPGAPARSPLPAMPPSRGGFGLPNLRRNVCPHFYLTGSRGAIPIQAPHLLKALLRQPNNISRCQLRGGVHLDEGYVNDVCLTPRFNQCVFYEDELTRE